VTTTVEDAVVDYVVVGAGSSGCVVTHRLVLGDPDATTLLLEAGGPDDHPDIHDPRSVLKLWGSDLDWKYTTEPQGGLNGRRLMISRGKVLGGCSSIYAMLYVRGNRRDFDHWNYLGNQGWSYAQVLPLFKKSESFLPGASDYHGGEGPLSVTPIPDPSPVAVAFTQAVTELGYGGPDWDFNGPQQEEGGGLYQVTITPAGQRASTAVAFLKPVLSQPNLQVQTHAQVTRILLEGSRAVGVEYLKDGRLNHVRAHREVILCAGAFDSPRLLMLSGLGPAAELGKFGIPVVVDLPGVGQNLQDHLLLPLIFTSKTELPIPTFIAEAGLFVRTRPGIEQSSPDLQYHFSAGIPAFIPPQLGITDPTFFFVPILAQPHSRGRVGLHSRDPLAPPLLDPQYLSCEADVRVFLTGIQLAREIAQTQAFQPFTKAEITPGIHTSEAEQRQFIRNVASTVWHPVGTCKMGWDALAVVDPELRVHGVEGLRVADASVMPTITSGNTNAACLMIGEKAAALILP